MPPIPDPASETSALTHTGLASHLWDIANSAYPDQTPQNAASDQGLRCLFSWISVKNKIKLKNTPESPKIENGLVQLIGMKKSTRLIRMG